jgi:hypothetical protein
MFITQEFRGNHQQQGHHKLYERQSGVLIDATDIMDFVHPHAEGVGKQGSGEHIWA